MKRIILICLLAAVAVSSLLGQIPTNGLVAWYPFNGNANDASGNGNNGSINGATLTMNRFGNINTAYLFDGVNDYINVPDSPSLNFGVNIDFTVNLWINVTEPFPITLWGIIEKATPDGGPQSGWQFLLSSLKKLYSEPGPFTTNTLLTSNNWYMVTYIVERNSQTAKYLINGILDNQNISIEYLNNFSSSAPLRIGVDRTLSSWQNFFFRGKMDDVRIYNRALTQQEVTALFYENVTSSITGSILYNNVISTPIDDVQVILKQNNTSIDTTTTDLSGTFQFNNLNPGNYTFSFSTLKPFGGVDSSDAALLLAHLANMDTINDGIHLLAADVNNTNTLNALDVAKLYKRMDGSETSFARGDWLFVPVYGLDSVVLSNTNATANYWGICAGDVNGSYEPAIGPYVPMLTTDSVNAITTSTASVFGTVTSAGGLSVTARGFCYGTSPNPSLADSVMAAGSGIGSFTGNLSGLSTNTLYYCRAFATNSVGTAYGSQVSFTPQWTCGSSITVNHVAGNVAPVNKSVSYGTVTNIPGETAKCWITQNLGSDHQAISVDDATEASAGWYWQFNRKQGFKHDGTTRTPNTTWIYPINETSDWITSNDPCSIELGSGWRIPTNTEWTNVDASGSWIDWNGPWSSGLKLHAAGVIVGGGSFANRGIVGYYFGSNQYDATNSWYLYFHSTDSYVGNVAKASGVTIRCIKDSPNPTLSTVTTTAITNIATTTATTGGNITSDGGALVTARGVCWSTTANPTIANSKTIDGSGSGSFVSNLAGLSAGTTYYVRAYATNSAGTAYGNELSFTTLTFTCGSSITVNHVAGDVAPVNKTVTYSTVSNIPGEPAKCWITQNLGADHQASSVNDATEASAGWYWQFNRKQGYKHDGTTRTPNTSWITSLSENSDWITANDPCAIELGGGWRIPTNTEFTSIDVSGNWTDWNGPWNSGLKLHTAGFLDYSNGSLLSRSSQGNYWCSSQSDSNFGWYLFFFSGYSDVAASFKVSAFSVRCIKDSPNPILSTVTTTVISNIAATTASSGGNVTSDGGALVTARGVCWGTTVNPTIANSKTIDGSGSGSFSSNITGLLAGTTYYVRAYATNSAGTAYGNEVTFTTLWTCGSVITVNHIAGVVSPVNKSVSYGTVTNIPGETAKCWITQNLGSDHQAISVDDASEASAGWYWQFNRKQGFKHDGTTRTPNTTWISSISETSDWNTENDPCAIELGSGWRIPSFSEWANVDASGGWTSWIGTWNSALKLHAAGYLNASNGVPYQRGSYGTYWGNAHVQNDPTAGWGLTFHSGNSSVNGNDKASGFSVRCIKDSSNPALGTVTTTAITNITQTTATTGGNIISDGGAAVTARGVCWSTAANPTIANSKTNDGSGSGSFVSNLTGLLVGTTYYVRAYATNSAGTGYGNELSFSTLPFTCGSSITINHVAGNVAPVNKTVTYGTVTNIPGETTKCWITQNLGSDHQAMAVDDATEASAGWYWQFNRKQGFKHNGTTRTPNTTWISSISENTNWITANDPCAIELGNGWRIPTSTEWTNVDASESWTTWTGPWNSELKLHAAGHLHGTTDGSLDYRGTNGYYWSSTQGDDIFGWWLSFFITGSNVYNNNKANGFSVRCIKNLNAPTVSTTAVTSIAATTAISGGNISSDGGALVTARGVCWSTTANPTIANSKTIDGSGSGVFTSNLTGLTANTLYYVRAYATNCVGTTYGIDVSFTTLWSCGSSITVNHVAGTVAPVNKSVTYGTVTNIPGEPAKCWITSNLGSDHQATAVNDATEASAGWYWQFNRKQGFKHDGTTLTPAWTIISINENSNWLPTNDPCTLELGSSWRLPTNTEWTNIDANGNWLNWNGPWNSGLKLHAAGYLLNSSGALHNRSSFGLYWSSVQNDAASGWDLDFGSSDSDMSYDYKAYGFSVRCLRDN